MWTRIFILSFYVAIVSTIICLVEGWRELKEKRKRGLK